MSRETARSLAAFLFFGWLANGALLPWIGDDHELYPFTAYPMFSGNSGTPTFDVVQHVFFVEVRPGAELREVPATEMIARRLTYGRSRTRSFLGKLARSLEGAGSTAHERGRAVPPDLASIWLANSRTWLGLDASPHAVHFARRVIPLRQSFASLRHRRGRTETIAVVTATGEGR